MDIQAFISLNKKDTLGAAKTLNSDDIAFLVNLLKEKEDTLRYPSSLLLQRRCEIKDDVYPYWRSFVNMLESENAFHRSIGLILLAKNARWDKEEKLKSVFDRFLSFCDDEKPMVVRFCIQALCEILQYKPDLHEKAVQKLISIDLSRRKDTQQRLLLKDITDVFLSIRNGKMKEDADAYLLHALNGALLNKKDKEEIKTKMGV